MFQSFFPLFLLVYEFCSYLSNDMYLPALVKLQQDLATTEAVGQLTITAWYAGMVLPQIWAGTLADRYGRRVVLFFGALLFLCGTAGCALSQDIHLFLLFRFLEGAGVACLLVSGYSTIHDTFSDEKAIQIIAWMGCIVVIAPMFGPLLGGYFLQEYSWRMIFWAIFWVSLFAIGLLYLSMPETSKRVPEKRAYRTLLQDRSFLLGSISSGALIGILIAWISASPFLLMQECLLSPIAFGWAQVPIFAAYALATRLVTPLLKYMGSQKLLGLGMAFIAFALALLLALPYLVEEYWYRLILPMSLYGVGFGLIAALLNRLVFTATEVCKGAVTALFYVVEMSIATFITLLITVVPFIHLAAGVACLACLGIRRLNRQKALVL